MILIKYKKFKLVITVRFVVCLLVVFQLNSDLFGFCPCSYNVHYTHYNEVFNMKSVVSYPDRGPWGDAKWRGNCSGHIIRDIVNHYKPSLFVDACEGSGTSGDVCRELGVDYVGLDLHKGNDFTRDSILKALPRPADVVFTHPPYHSMIKYADHPNDTSRCKTVEEFLEKSQVMLLNQRHATRDGGVYATLIGDMRKNGTFRSFQADFISMMPRSEHVSTIIKMQHNCLSDGRVYSGSFVPIMHEYLLIWKKSAKTLFAVTIEKAREFQRQIASTWRSAIRIAMMQIGKACSLERIYAEVEKVAGHLIEKNKNWKAKIRQKLQQHHTSVERGVWAI